MSSWRAATLADVADVVGRGITPKYLNDGDVVVLNQKCVRDGSLNLELARRHDGTSKQVKPEKYLRVGDVLVNSTGTGTLGRTAPVRVLPGRATADSHLTIVRPKSGTDPLWLAYSLSLNEPRIAAMAEGSTGQTELSRHQLSLLRLDVPPLAEQERISAVLDSLDGKTAANRRLASLALELAGALYKRSTAGELVNCAVGEVAEFHNRRRVPLSRVQREERAGPIPYYGATGVFGHVDDYLFDEVLVLVGEDGSVVNADGTPVTQYIWGKSWINNHAHALTGNGISNELLLLALQSSDVRPLVTGAVQPKISMTNLKSLALAIPCPDRRESLEVDIEPLFRLYRQRIVECGRLATLRSALLPELLSGRTRVDGVGEMSEANA